MDRPGLRRVATPPDELPDEVPRGLGPEPRDLLDIADGEDGSTLLVEYREESSTGAP
jgi:hypothetical protein